MSNRLQFPEFVKMSDSRSPRSASSKMRAIVQRGYGPPETLQLRTVERPAVGDDQVMVRVRASSVNHGDWLALVGKPYSLRLVTGLLRPRHPIIGLDIAGEVEAVGRKVTRFRPGDAVYGEGSGAHAEFVAVSEDRLAAKPSRLSFEQAGAVPVAGVTALQGLRDKANVRPGDAVLINGASGGVGTFAVQIAKALGAEVTAVCRGSSADLVRSIGADHVVDYTEQDFTQTSRRYDVVFDLVGSAPMSACLRIIEPKGVYIASVGRLGWVLRAFVASVVPRSKVRVLAAQPNASSLAALAELIDAGTVTPVIDRVFPLSEVPEALRRQGQGHARGKSIIVL